MMDEGSSATNTLASVAATAVSHNFNRPNCVPWTVGDANDTTRG